ncbi:class I SAM-dependent methyltransferase [Simplicispira suum]|nr:class I SAM-dependent methyltransferase [Simplicispira suum]
MAAMKDSDVGQGGPEMRAYYAARAEEYDAVYCKSERQFDLRAIKAWLPARFAGAQVLEIACGTGYWTQFIAPVARSVWALDAAPETLRVARARGLGAHVHWMAGDAYALPMARRVWDAAFAGFWFSHVPQARRVEFLAGLHASLAPGARVVLLDNRFVAGSSTPLCDTDANGDTWQRRPLRDGSVHRILKNFPDAQELHAAVRQAGAAEGSLTQWPHYWAYAYCTPQPAAPGHSR